MAEIVSRASTAGRCEVSDGESMMRLSDADRQAAVRLLDEAVADGRVDLAEFEFRVQAAYAARTRGDLQPLTFDLAIPEDAQRDAGMSLLVKIWVVWATVVAVNFAIWGMLTTAVGGGIHPWPIWLAVPPGIALLGLTAFNKVGRQRS